ncbi:chromosomal replication initiator protein DnaA, partial [Patescibacteria group bacterium]|nr:chromosomal replication initiator protein DnaA [Patescibacteria group bacterium]
KNLHLQIKQSLDKATGKNCEIQYVVGSIVFSPATNRMNKARQSGFSTVGKTIKPELKMNDFENRQSPRVEDLFSESILTSASEDRTTALARAIGLRKDYTFETFAVSTTNEMAHAAATAVSNRPGTAYNPLFLYGGVGVGKTHLMHAIGNNIIKNDPNKKIIYCTGEEFTNEIVQSIQKKNTNLFKSKFRNADVLLIDDVQFIAGKNAVQEEFFHTFNALSKQQGQIVLTSDKPPHEMNLLEDRLRSRFEAGLMIDIQIPSFELRTAILLVKSKAAGLSIPIDIAKTIASRVESARKIEGVITSIRSEIELKGKFISEELINSLLDTEVVEKRPRISASPSEIIKTVANHYRLKQTALKGKRRVKSLVVARHIAMYLLKNELNLPLAEIGRWFSGRDHTSVLHAVRKVERDLKTNDSTMRDISALRTTLSLTSH